MVPAAWFQCNPIVLVIVVSWCRRTVLHNTSTLVQQPLMSSGTPGPLVVDKPVHTGAAAVGVGNGSSGQHAQMQVDVLEVEVDDVAMSAPAADSAGQKRAQSSSSQGSANSRPRGPMTGDDCKDAPTVTESSLL